jgi:N-glycosylase/DNA lyase
MGGASAPSASVPSLRCSRSPEFHAAARDSRAILFPVRDYDLAATLASGQAFRWRPMGETWEGVIAGHLFRLRQLPEGVSAELLGSTASSHAPRTTHHALLRRFLQLDVDLPAILATFPDDEPMRASVAACRGLRLLRQEPWETLVSFICSSTKQIVQIQQIIALLCERFGEPIPAAAEVRRLHSNAESRARNAECKTEPPHVGCCPAFAFPTPERLATCSEADLRACKMGFRAPYVLAAAKAVAMGGLDLNRLHALPTAEARAALMGLHGVGRKIADCVLLFAYGKQDAFPVDVWVRRALTELYFPRRRPAAKRLEKFANTHFGPNAGYAQQYLFHYVRVKRSG